MKGQGFPTMESKYKIDGVMGRLDAAVWFLLATKALLYAASVIWALALVPARPIRTGITILAVLVFFAVAYGCVWIGRKRWAGISCIAAIRGALRKNEVKS